MLRTTLKNLLFGSAIVVSGVFATNNLTVEQRVQDFEHFWQSYKDAYVFFELKHGDYGVDWDMIKGQFIERLKNSDSDLDLYAAVTEAQTLLRDGHCYNGSFAKIRETERIYFQRIGLTLVDGNKIAVTKVVDGSAFAEAGIQTGYELVKFDGKTIRQLAKEARKYNAASSESQFWSIFSGQLYIHNPLKGKPSSPRAELVFRDLDGNLITVKSRWNSADPTGPQNTNQGWIDDEQGVQLSEADQKRIDGPLPIEVRVFEKQNIGYVKIDSWMKTEDPIEQFEDVFSAIKDTDGLVLDMRDNGGGVGPWGVLFSNYFIQKSTDKKKKGWISKVADWFKGDKGEAAPTPDGAKAPNDTWFERKLSKVFFRAAFPQLDEPTLQQIFTQPEMMQLVLKKAFGMEVSQEELQKYFKNGEFEAFYVNLSLNDRLNKIAPYTKPVYVLTNGGCYSTTDICMTILKDFGRIKLIGTPNGAGSGSPIPFVLPNSGLQVYVPHARAYPPHGTMIEGRPLQVDTRVMQNIDDLIKGKDTVLTEAVKQLTQEIMPMSTFASDEEVGEGELAFSTIPEEEIEWGILKTPDWAINATIEHIKRSNMELTK